MVRYYDVSINKFRMTSIGISLFQFSRPKKERIASTEGKTKEQQQKNPYCSKVTMEQLQR